MSKNDLNGLIDEALENIRKDRRTAKEFLNEIATQIAIDADNNRSLSPVAAKHVETMQRSNEQLVKIISLRLKKQESTMELSDDDKAQIFDLIQEPGENRGAE
jgi:hypothetical protein